MIPVLVILLFIVTPIENIDLSVYHVRNWGDVEVDLIPMKPRIQNKFQRMIDDISSNIDFATCVEGFCDARTYPDDLIRSTLDHHKHFKNYFGQIVEPFVKVTDRDSGKANADNLCKTISERKFPKIGKNVNGTYRYIVNLDQGYEQSIRFEICQKDNHHCGAGHYKPINTTCSQVYNVMKLMVLGEDDGKKPILDLEEFKIPSTCACHYDNKDF